MLYFSVHSFISNKTHFSPEDDRANGDSCTQIRFLLSEGETFSELNKNVRLNSAGLDSANEMDHERCQFATSTFNVVFRSMSG